MIRAGAALVVLLWPSAAAAEFRPVEDRAYSYETVETRSADGVVRRFHAHRSVVFHRTDTGYAVTVTLDAVDEGAGDATGRMFRAATGALLGKPLRFRLDPNGTVLDIEDADAAIALIADAIERMTPHRDRSGDARILASPLRRLPSERKRAMLGSILAPVIAGAAADQPSGTRTIRVPSRPPLPPGTALAGIETVTRGPGKIVTVDIQADGAIDAAAPPETHGHDLAATAHTPTATIRSRRTLDAATGLVRELRDRTETRVTEGNTVHFSTIETTITLRLPG
ncbi:hypothetical protein AB5I39_04565 [Sphingomonas sp. MMS24-J45]|uniref:hypothetical protein n=1 Tax=Sphingomonas sp. MMS24-J45 TaxID=3238806 RepID=UPI00384F4374